MLHSFSFVFHCVNQVIINVQYMTSSIFDGVVGSVAPVARSADVIVNSTAGITRSADAIVNTATAIGGTIADTIVRTAATASIAADNFFRLANAIISAVAGIVELWQFCALCSAILLFILVRFQVIKHLDATLRKQNSPKTIAELKWVNKKYVQHTLLKHDKHGKNDTHPLREAYTADNPYINSDRVLKDLRRIKNSVIGIVGKAGTGKTEMLMWLYMKLSRSPRRRCAFIRIAHFENVTDILKSITKQLNTVKKYAPLCRAYIFIDAIDEATQLFSAEKIFNNFFITNLINNIELENCSVVFSVRDEYYEQGVEDIVENCRLGSSSPTIFRIQEMGPAQIISIFKSFRYAKRIEKRLSKINNFNHRFQNTLPKTNMRKAIKEFEGYIERQYDTIFKYPVFIRYANMLMEEGDNTLDSMSLDDSLKAISVIVEKLIKWEFHAIHKGENAYFKNGNNKKPKYISFEDSIYRMANLILKNMLNENKISRSVDREIVVRACNASFPSEGDKQANPTQVAHCLFSWDKSETVFEFHNSIFWDYFASKYIYEQSDDYKVRKKMFNDRSGGTLSYLSAIEFYFQRLWNLSPGNSKKLLDDYILTHRIEVDIAKDPCLTKWYKKLPFDNMHFWLSSNAYFESATIFNIIENHRLVINRENMLFIDKASDIKALCTSAELNTLTHIAFHELKDKNFDISFLFGLPNLKYMTLPPYHKAFLQLGKYNNTSIRKLQLWSRTPYREAKTRFYGGKNTKSDIELLKTIFDLEVEETRYMGSKNGIINLKAEETADMGLDKNNNFSLGILETDDMDSEDALFNLDILPYEMDLSELKYHSTCWTTLSLAEAYRNKATYETIDEQYVVLHKIFNTIISCQDDKELYRRFCYDWGCLFLNRKNIKSAIKQLLVLYNSSADKTFVRFSRYDFCCALVKAYVWERDIDNAVSVLNEIESRYTIANTSVEFYKVRCAVRFYEMKRIYESPTTEIVNKAFTALRDYELAEKTTDSIRNTCGWYASEFYIIIGKFDKVKLIIDEMDSELNKTCMKDDYDEEYQGNWIRYHETLLLYQYLTEDHKKAIKTASDLLKYNYRTREIKKKPIQYIKNKCEAALNPGVSVDESLFVDYDFFRRSHIWI